MPKNTEDLFKLEISDLLNKILEERDSRFERLKSVSDLFSFIDPKTLLCMDSNSLRKCVDDIAIKYQGRVILNQLIR
jgi:hypothetical protein